MERRLKQNIPLDEKDYPVSEIYVQNLEDLGFKVLKKSRWLNAVSVYATVNDIMKLQNLPYIVKIQPVTKWKVHKVPVSVLDKTLSNYGNSEIQNTMIDMPYLHDKGYTGAGMLIGIFDSGFIKANLHRAFKRVYDNQRVVATYNFVNNDTNVYTLDNHGTYVWSCIASYVPDTMIGTGYDASFILAVTEDVGSETTAEEDNWLAAMEWADSLGVDIINTSLGYNVMDDGIHYTYQDMDGNTTIITRAADIAASKGILCVIAAGNEGNGSWQKITAPCDADSVLCVGSVNFNRLRSSFSSMGPTADGRIKPDVMAMGGFAAVASSNLDFTYSSGTSFATPIITGLVACLWQANPTKSNMEILQAIKNSADRAYNPDTLYGWGIPNAARADSLLKGLPISNEKSKLFTIKIYPNPAKNKIYIENISLPAQIRLYDFTGKLIDEKVIFQNEYEIKPVSEGWYWLNITMDSIQNSQKIQIKH